MLASCTVTKRKLECRHWWACNSHTVKITQASYGWLTIAVCLNWLHIWRWCHQLCCWMRHLHWNRHRNRHIDHSVNENRNRYSLLDGLWNRNRNRILNWCWYGHWNLNLNCHWSWYASLDDIRHWHANMNRLRHRHRHLDWCGYWEWNILCNGLWHMNRHIDVSGAHLLLSNLLWTSIRNLQLNFHFVAKLGN